MTWPADAHRPFIARRARLAAFAVGVPTAVLAVLGSALMPTGYPFASRAAIVAVAAAVCWFLYREGSVRLTPSAHGVEVRNVLRTTCLEWADLVDVDFGSGSPWARLDLASADVLAVMAIQRADGRRAVHEAARLAALIESHAGVEPY